MDDVGEVAAMTIWVEAWRDRRAAALRKLGASDELWGTVWVQAMDHLEKVPAKAAACPQSGQFTLSQIATNLCGENSSPCAAMACSRCGLPARTQPQHKRGEAGTKTARRCGAAMTLASPLQHA
eukprot:365688-Chlamydomonas_euryale.AAC.13